MTQARRNARGRSEQLQPVAWNVLTSSWLEAIDLRGKVRAVAPVDALANATKIHRLVAANPLDAFAVHRFLITLLYWVSGNPNGVHRLRSALLRGKVPQVLLKRLAGQAEHFGLFDAKRPFMQDAKVAGAKKSTPAYLFAEMASGTNVAHFDHADDENTQLCLRCASLGLLRLAPWMQSGGAGLSPAIHGAPPIMPLAIGRNLSETLGLNLLPLKLNHGKPQWSGQFRPSSSRVSLLEGLTWNARRVHLLEPSEPSACSRCGETALPVVGRIIFEKNDLCKKDPKRVWRDPSAFYSLKDGAPVATVKSGKEALAATGSDLRNLFERTYGKKVEPAPSSLVVEANANHGLWYVVVPCTNPANNKSYDHRAIWLDGFGGPPPKHRADWSKTVPVEAGDPRDAKTADAIAPTKGAVAFVRAAATLDAGAWGIMQSARAMDDDPAAFDVFTSIYWPLRNKVPSLPCRPAAWLALKLMAAAGKLRPSLGPGRRHNFQPWSELQMHQPDARTRDGRVRRYPRALPTGSQLETELRRIIERYASSKTASGIDWPGTCQFLHNVLS